MKAMDLGLQQLTDDQLVDLLQQACAELGTREHYVRTAAQKVIKDEADKMKMFRYGLEQAVTAVRKKYETELFQEIYAWVEDGVKAGTMRVMTPTEEAAAIAKAQQEAQEAVARGIGAQVYADSKRQIEANLEALRQREERQNRAQRTSPYGPAY